MSNNVNERLPFSEPKQLAVLGHALTDPEFRNVALRWVDADQFVNPHAGKVFHAFKEFAEKHNRTPTVPELRELWVILQEEPSTREKLFARIDEAVEQTKVYGADALKGELLEWKQSTDFQRAMQESVALYNQQGHGKAREVLRTALDEIDGLSLGTGLSRFGGRFTVEQLSTPPEPRKWIWQEAIPADPEVGTFVSPGGLGKSTAAMQIAVARACGMDSYLGRSLSPGETCFVTLEESMRGIRDRIESAGRSFGDRYDREAVANKVSFLSLVGVPFALIRAENRGWVVDSAAVAQLADAINEIAPNADLVFLETISRLGGDESPPSHACLISATEEVARRCNATVVLIGHVSKETAKNRSTDAQSIRGGSSASDNARFNIAMALFPENADRQKRLLNVDVPPEIAKDLMVIHVNKINGAPDQAPFVVRRQPTGWGWSLSVFNPEDQGAVDAIVAHTRARNRDFARQVAEAVHKLTELGKTASKEALNRGYRKQLSFRVPRSLLNEAIALAKAEGWIIDGPRGALAPGKLPTKPTAKEQVDSALGTMAGA